MAARAKTPPMGRSRDAGAFTGAWSAESFGKSLPAAAARRSFDSHIFAIAGTNHMRKTTMRLSSKFRAALIGMSALAGMSSALTGAARADEGTIQFRVVKAGFIVGGSGGSGTLFFHGRRYPISIGGISYGFLIGASETNFRGRVSNIRRPSDVAGVYAAGGAGAAIGAGAQAIVLTNQNGAVLALSGRQVGLQVNADLSGLAISLR